MDAGEAFIKANERQIRDRAGYRRGSIYYFNKAALNEATEGFDHAFVTEVLKACGALEPGKDRPAQQHRFGGVNSRYYVINADRLLET